MCAHARWWCGATGSGADSVIFPYILNGVLGTKFRVVTGYPGATDFLLAMERGETDGTAGVSWGTVSAGKPDWIRGHKINIMVQLGTRKHPDLGAAPLVLDFAKTESDRGVLELIFSRQEMAYPVVAPPGVPAERVQALRQAFAATDERSGVSRRCKTADARDRRRSAERDIAALIDRLYAKPAGGRRARQGGAGGRQEDHRQQVTPGKV